MRTALFGSTRSKDQNLQPGAACTAWVWLVFYLLVVTSSLNLALRYLRKANPLLRRHPRTRTVRNDVRAKRFFCACRLEDDKRVRTRLREVLQSGRACVKCCISNAATDFRNFDTPEDSFVGSERS